MISLTRSDNGLPVSTFGIGAAMSSSGGAVNGGGGAFTPGSTFGAAARSGLSGAGFSANTASPASQTVAGSTQGFGYATLGGTSRGANRGGAGAGGSGRQSTIPQLGTDEPIGVPDAGDDSPQKVQLVPEQQQHGRMRVPNFLKGSTDGRPGGDLPDTGADEASATAGDVLEGAAL